MPTIQVCSRYVLHDNAAKNSLFPVSHSTFLPNGKAPPIPQNRSIIVINGRYRPFVKVSLFCKPFRENSPPSPYLTDYFLKGLLFNFPQNKIIVLNFEKKIHGLAFISVINSRKQNESITNTYNSVQNLSKHENLHFSIEVITLLSHTVKSTVNKC